MNGIKSSWRNLSTNGIFIAVLDFFLLVLAVYSGYAVRLGIVIPRYIADWLHVGFTLPVVCVIFFALFGQYRTIWMHAGPEDYAKFLWLYVTSVLTFLLINGIFRLAVFPRTSFAISFFAGLFLCGGLRVSWLMVRPKAALPKTQRMKALIAGAGEAGSFLARDLMRNESELYPAGFVDDDPQKVGRSISGLKVFGTTGDIREIVRREGIQTVLIAIPSARGAKIREIYDAMTGLNIQVRILPSLRELADGAVSVSRLRKVRLEDLLGRDPVRIDLEPERNYIRDKRVLITGAGGSIGSEIVRQVLHNKPGEVYVLGHGEQSIYLLTESLKDTGIKPIIADAADGVAMNDVFSKYHPEVVFHAAAHKHVPLMEYSVREAMRVNDLGTRTLAQMSGKYGAERMVMISSDKAVNPSSVMGATKRLAEKILEHEQKNYPGTKYMAVRFGNVLGSRGSVIPKFEEQIASGGPVTVTHPDMKRYFMLIPEAVSLVIQAGALGSGGELFVLDMGEPVIIRDMAELLIRLCGYEPYRDIDIVYTGIRPGEKLYEELFYDDKTVKRTAHDKIYVSRIKNDTVIELDDMLDYALFHPDDALRLLKELVPEYNNSPLP